MKERFVLAVSWWVFLHAAVLYLVFAAVALFDWSPGDGVVNDLLDGYYDGLWQSLPMAFGFPVAAWVVLWIVTGSPRILPWRK